MKDRGACVMREDDENIRLYTPILQRIIILAAVIIAVPVVMWTITTFVRTYVAPPPVPTFQHLPDDQASNTPAPDGSASAPAPAPPTPDESAAQPANGQAQLIQI